MYSMSVWARLNGGLVGAMHRCGRVWPREVAAAIDRDTTKVFNGVFFAHECRAGLWEATIGSSEEDEAGVVMPAPGSYRGKCSDFPKILHRNVFEGRAHRRRGCRGGSRAVLRGGGMRLTGS